MLPVLFFPVTRHPSLSLCRIPSNAHREAPSPDHHPSRSGSRSLRGLAFGGRARISDGCFTGRRHGRNGFSRADDSARAGNGSARRQKRAQRKTRAHRHRRVQSHDEQSSPGGISRQERRDRAKADQQRKPRFVSQRRGGAAQDNGFYALMSEAVVTLRVLPGSFTSAFRLLRRASAPLRE
jgi:hypothetical protein